VAVAVGTVELAVAVSVSGGGGRVIVSGATVGKVSRSVVAVSEVGAGS
jgi:NAD(P)H-dependent flavin oxidoreductase YrpB (nitropropane dioxygenase family)